MNRRNFLQLLGAAGMTAVAVKPDWLYAADPNRHYVFVHAGGGWDPTSLCDPKGNRARMDGRGPVNHYLESDIQQIAGSPIRYAPFPNELLATSTLREDMPIASYDDFFTELAPNLLVMNGIDMQTNNHDTGTRIMWSGSDVQTQPAFAALVAQAQAPNSPLAFLTNGGYDYSGSLIAPTRISGSGVLRELVYPERYNTNANADLDNQNTYYLHPDIYQLTENAREQRLQKLMNETSLPQRREAISRLFTVQGGESNLDRLIQNLPTSISNGLRGQAEIAVAAFQSQVAACANLSVGGFDTHGAHDRNQTNSLANLIDGVHHLWDLIRNAGLADRVTVLVGSDFGRTPYYNDGNGKDHWNVTSMLAFGAGVTGNRVIGGTDANYGALNIDPTTLQPVPDQDDPNAVRLTSGHIHHALRRMSGIENDPITRQYALEGSFLPIFG